MASIKQAKAAVKTPVAAAAQIPEVLTQALPHLPAPINIDLPAPSASEPNPPATAIVPATDLQPIYDEIQDCRVCQTKLAAAQSDLSDERTKRAALCRRAGRQQTKSRPRRELLVASKEQRQMASTRSRSRSHSRRSNKSQRPLTAQRPIIYIMFL